MSTSTSKNFNITVEVRPDLSVLAVFVQSALWPKYIHDDTATKLTEAQGLTPDKLIAYCHDCIVARTLQVQNAVEYKKYKNFGFFRQLYLPVGFGPFVVGRIGQSSLDENVYYTVTPKLPDDYAPDTSVLMDDSFVEGPEHKLSEQFILTRSQLVKISNSLANLYSVLPAMNDQFPKNVKVKSHAIFAYMEQVTKDDISITGNRQVNILTGMDTNMDDADLYVAMIVGFTQPNKEWRWCYPTFESIPVARVSDVYASDLKDGEGKSDSTYNSSTKPEFHRKDKKSK